MDQSYTGIAHIPRTREAEAVAVLSRAFDSDPAARYILQSVPDYQTSVRDFFHFLCEVQFELECPPLGSFFEGQLVGVVCPSEPTPKSRPESLAELWESLQASIGLEGTKRLERYRRVINRHSPDRPHFYVAAVGVEPEIQGQGHGRELLDAVHRMSECHSTSTGVALDTENPLNVPVYEHLGYHVVAKTKLDELNVWLMFRPNEGK